MAAVSPLDNVTTDIKLILQEEKNSRGVRATIHDSQHEALVDVVNARRKLDEIYRTAGFVISPHSKIYKAWEVIIMVVTIFLIFWTPFHVGFRSHSIQNLPEFVVSRFVDVTLLVDMQLGFHVSYIDQKTGDYVRKLKEIIRHHLQGWFFFDLLVSLVGSVEFLTFGMNAVDSYDQDRVMAFQTLKLLRVMKAFKVYNGGGAKLFSRWIQERINYDQLSLLKFIIGIITLSHWLACAWRLVCNLEYMNPDNWIAREGLLDTGTWDLYIICLYWATTTITTIGYGDAANPKTSSERVLATFCMMAGALLWAYIIGGVCSIVQSFNQSEILFKETMDRLNNFMKEKRLPDELRDRLREYFVQRQIMLQDIKHAELLSGMSATLRGEVALCVNKGWLSHVPWLLDGAPGFIASIALGMEPELFAPKEAIMGSHLRVLTRGVAVKDSCIYTRGCVWGTDVILESSKLRRGGAARALTYAHVYALRQSKLKQILEHYPQERVRLRASAVWLALRRGFLRYARDIKAAGLHISAMANKARAQGRDIKKLFIHHDRDGSGDLDRQEFMTVLEDLGCQLDDYLLDIVLSRFDDDGTGSVDYVEFLTFFCPEVLEDKDKEGLAQLKMQVVRSDKNFGIVSAFASEAPVDSVVTGRQGRGTVTASNVTDLIDEKLSNTKAALLNEVRGVLSEFATQFSVQLQEARKQENASQSKKTNSRNYTSELETEMIE